MSPPEVAGHHITFRLGDELFAIHVRHVREVLDLGPVTRVPTSPAYLRGVVNVRGKAIPVVDLRVLFGLAPGADTRSTRVLVLELELEGAPCVVGGVADSVQAVIEVDAAQIEPSPALGSRWSASTVRGLVRHEQDFIQILETSSVFFDSALAAAIQRDAAGA